MAPNLKDGWVFKKFKTGAAHLRGFGFLGALGRRSSVLWTGCHELGKRLCKVSRDVKEVNGRLNIQCP